jgi:hypothetical protein
MRTSWLASFAVFFLGVVALAQGDAKRGPSTAEERQRFLAITHRMQETPLDPDLRPEREWALRWLAVVPDITASVCTAPLGEFMKKKYKYSPEIVIQLTFSSGAFVIEHPEQAKDAMSQYIAGVEGALKAYQSILKVKPDTKSKELDDLVQKQNQGTLSSYVREMAANGCRGASAGGL